MNKLKTLKDLNGWGYGIPIEDGGFFTDSFFVDSHILKQEAIKWVNFHRKINRDGCGEEEFMDFHNITEEELLEK